MEKIVPPPSSILKDPTHPLGYVVKNAQEFVSDSIRLVRKCTKPDAKEFQEMVKVCSYGLLIMGFIGFVVKLFFIPINNIIMGSG